jgi:hypothetical protein
LKKLRLEEPLLAGRPMEAVLLAAVFVCPGIFCPAAGVLVGADVVGFTGLDVAVDLGVFEGFVGIPVFGCGYWALLRPG